MIIGLDVDGTIVYQRYPNMGEELPNCINVLKKLIKDGHKIVLNTMRCGKELRDAVDFLQDRGVMLYGINRNPTQGEWTTSPKIHAHLYIDDLSLGIPLKYDDTQPYIDWYKVEEMLIEMGVIIS